MSQEYPGVYVPSDDPNTYQSTPLANAGWYDKGQHGGAIAALVTGHVEKIPTLAPMEVSRVTIEIFRVVPLVPLTIETEIVREGKKIQVVRATVTSPDGLALAIAHVQRLRTTEAVVPDLSQPLRLPTPDQIEGRKLSRWGHGDTDKVMFHRGAIEVREIFGGFNEMGPGAIWLRLTTPLVAGETPTPAQRAVVIADFCNGVSRGIGDDWIFMNPDLTVHIGRYPEGDWVALEAESHYEHHGRGVAAGIIWDQKGWVGRSAQTLFLDHLT